MQKESSSAQQKPNYCCDDDRDFLNQLTTANNFVVFNKSSLSNQDNLQLQSLQPTPIGVVSSTINVVDQLSPNAFQYYSYAAARDLHDWADLIRDSSEDKNFKPDPSSNTTKKPSSNMMMTMPTNDDEQEWFSSVRALQGPTSISDLVATSEEVSADLTKIRGVASLPKPEEVGEGREEEEDSHEDEKFSPKGEGLQIHEHQNEKWNERYQQLVDFHRIHGHSVVPYHYKECPPLAWWVKR
jgi:hypothetical protein